MNRFNDILDHSAANNLKPDAAAQGLSRRGFMIAAGATGITFAFAAPEWAKAHAAGISEQMFEPTVWYQITEDGVVTVNINKSEMGQHVGTALARIVAEELEADWKAVRINHVDTDPKWGEFSTGGSWSVWRNYLPLSRAGAAGRMALIDAAAKLLGVPADACTARNSVVTAGNQSLTYGEIIRRGDVSRSYSAKEIEALPVKPPEQRRLISKDTRALDIPAKTNGTATYSIDAKVDGMLYGRPLMPPTRYGSKVNGIDDSAAKSVPGYFKTVAIDDPTNTVSGYVVVLAESYPAAISAAENVKVDWTAGKTANVSEADIIEFGRKQIDDAAGGSLLVDDEGVDDAFKNADTVIEHTYTTGTAIQFQLEPVNAIAYQTDSGGWEILTGSQWQSLSLPLIAKALKVRESQIVMRTHLLGGGFGRRLNDDYVVMTALAAKSVSRPVKLVFTREDDSLFASGRSPSIQKLRLAIDSDKKISAMEHHVAAGWPTEVMAPQFLSKGINGVPYDPFAIHGAAHWYSLGDNRLRAISNTLANDTFRPGWLRSVGAGFVNWALESFIDEVAHGVGEDPLEFRLSRLKAEGRNAGHSPDAVGGANRQAAVLRRAAELGEYGGKLPKGTGIGIATTHGQEREMPTWTACAARVRVDRKTGKVFCERLSLVIDCGTLIHPNGALAQAEGGALWGLTLALHEGTKFKQGQVADTNLDSYTPLRMRDVPELEVEFIQNSETPVGMGEPPTTVIAPAIGNAIFAAVGARVRDLPINPEKLLEALNS